MKKIYMFFLLMLISSVAFAQCFVYEGFDAGSMPPNGWTINGLSGQWSAANSSTAGGVMPEGKFTYVQQTTTTRLISPEMNLSGLTSVKLSFRHMYDDYSGTGPLLGVATRSNNGTWTSVWEINPTSNVGPELIEINISNSDIGQSDFEFCFYLNGNMFNIDYWYVDNILVYNPLSINASLISVQTPKYMAEPITVKGSVMNVGNTPITSLGMSWQLDNGIVHSETFNGLNVQLEEIYDFDFADLLNTIIGDHNLLVWINTVNGSPDNDLYDDTLVKPITKVCNTIPRIPIFEEFTSSTCAPCASFNTGFVPWCQDHDTSITLLKYQMSWPAPGDPYYTEEGGVRRTYYGVNAVPDLYCNGGNVATSVGDVQAAFDAAITLPGLLDISTGYSLANKIITINSTILPFANFQNALINIGIYEQVTYNNTGNNGETEFHHVMMKMVPDAAGTVTNLSDRVPYTINQTLDLNSTNIERWDDVKVVVFIQDFTGKEIYQSEYALLDAQYATEARLSDILVDGAGIAGFSSDVTDYVYTLASGSVEIPDIAGIPIDPDATVIVVPAYEIPGTTTIDVFAEDLSVKKTYTVNFDWPTGSNDLKSTAVSVYPNPSRGIVTISGANGSKISVVDSRGQILQTINNFSGTTLDLSNYSKGVLLLNINVQGKNPVHKKVVLY